MFSKNLIVLFVTAFLLMGVGIYEFTQEEEIYQYPEKKTETIEWIDSFQYNNMLFSGHTNNTNITFNNSGNLNINGSIQCYFEEYETYSGYLNISIYVDESLINSYHFQERGFFSFDYMPYNNTSNITIVLQSIGSDSDPFTEFADYYIFEMIAQVEYEG